jgi:hypothetical protein
VKQRLESSRTRFKWRFDPDDHHLRLFGPDDGSDAVEGNRLQAV